MFKKISEDKEALAQVRRGREALLAYADDHGGAERRRALGENARGLFDELLIIVADGVCRQAETDPDFVSQALTDLLGSFHTLLGKVERIETTTEKTLEAVNAGNAAADERHTETIAKLNNISDRFNENLTPRHTGHEPKLRFGSPPNRAVGFVGRDEQARLYAALGRPEQRGEAFESAAGNDAAGGFSAVDKLVVVRGMRGVGKSQLAAAYARECEEAGWSFVAWIDASSREALVAGLAGLAVEMGIDDGKGDPDVAACRCVNRLNSGEGDRLLVFDNVDDFDDLKKLIPHGQGLRVLVTTTVASPGDSAGHLIAVGAFTRPQSVDFIRERTGLDDDAGAARLAKALGDLPVALTQAAATIKLNGYATIDEYLAELRKYRLDEVVDRLPGDNYPDLVHAALRKAYESALDILADKDHSSGEEDLPRVGAASVQLAALALLAPSGVPRPWLHRIGTRMPIARQSLGALVAHSICTPSQDGRYIRIHGLQGRVLREDYNKQPKVFASLEKAVVTMLKGIDMDKADTNDAQRADALDLADHLRAIAEQQEGHVHYSPHEACIDLSSVTGVVGETISCLTNMGRPQIALTLEDAVGMLANDPGPDDPDTLAARSNLAAAYQGAGSVSTAIDRYEAVLADQTRVLGLDHPDTLATRNNLAGTRRNAGDLPTAIDMYEALLPDLIRILGLDHPDTLATRNNLASAHQDAGDLPTAIDMYETMLPDLIRILGLDHPDTLATRGNLAAAYYAAGDLQKAIDMYDTLLTDEILVLGPDHPHTLIVRSNLAGRHQDAGNLQTAIDMYETVLPDMTRVLGPNHPDTLATRGNLASVHKKAGDPQKAINIYKALLSDMTRMLGPDHPHTLAARGNLAGAHYAGGDLQKATDMCEALLPDLTRVFGPDHLYVYATRANLAAARKTQQASSPQADGEAESAPPPES